MNPKVEIKQSWLKILKNFFEAESFKDLMDFVRTEYLAGEMIYPEHENILNT